MRARRCLIVMALLLVSPPAQADSPSTAAEGSSDPCHPDFAPPGGKISARRVVKVAPQTASKAVEVESRKRKCGRQESDKTCLARARARWKKRAGKRQLHVELEMPYGGVFAVMTVDGERLARKFKDYNQAVDFTKARMAQGKEVVLKQMRQVKDRTRRTARVSIRRITTDTVPASRTVHLTWETDKPQEMPKKLMVLHGVAERSERDLLLFEVIGRAQVKLVFQCPAAE